jgi:hypothetical protein
VSSTALVTRPPGTRAAPARGARRASAGASAARVHRLGASAVVMAAAVLAISLAYTAGRAHLPGHQAWVAVYWLAEAALFAPAVWRALARFGPGEGEAAGLVTGLAVATYLVKYAYSPAGFGFPDELEHWRTTASLLASHHLFGANPLLPVSPYYPGLEEATGALVTVTGLPVFAAGLIVAGLSHLLFTAALYVMFRWVAGSARLALAAGTVYATSPHYPVFDAIYGYQTLALAFFGLAVVAAIRLAGHPRGGASRWVLAAGLAAATVVTHHVTSYLLAATVALAAAAAAIAARRPGRGRAGPAARDPAPLRLALLAAACLLLIAGWIRWVAPLTLAYLAPTARAFFGGLAGIAAAHPASGATPAGPLADQAASYAAVALIMLAIPLGWLHIWRSRRHQAWALALGAGASGYYLMAVLRVTTPHGAELAGRTLTFLYIPVSFTLAMAAAALAQAARRGPCHRARRRGLVVAAAGAVAVLLAGGLASGWPPFWERLPGGFAVDGFESGITREGIAAAGWARTTLGPGHLVAADFTNSLLLGSYGGENPLTGIGGLYCGPSWTGSDAWLARRDHLQYLVADLRTTSYLPPAGGYFGQDPAACPAPIPGQDLAKFGFVPGSSRVYDSGNIIIYALPGAQHAP